MLYEDCEEHMDSHTVVSPWRQTTTTTCLILTICFTLFLLIFIESPFFASMSPQCERVNRPRRWLILDKQEHSWCHSSTCHRRWAHVTSARSCSKRSGWEKMNVLPVLQSHLLKCREVELEPGFQKYSLHESPNPLMPLHFILLLSTKANFETHFFLSFLPSFKRFGKLKVLLVENF